jgi:hypothetical protein
LQPFDPQSYILMTHHCARARVSDPAFQQLLFSKSIALRKVPTASWLSSAISRSGIGRAPLPTASGRDIADLSAICTLGRCWALSLWHLRVLPWCIPSLKIDTLLMHWVWGAT